MPARHEAYDPRTARLLEFRSNVAAFLNGGDSPRAYLERCLATIAEREPDVKAFVTIDVERGRRVADESSARYRAGRPLSPVDGMPVGIKDVFATADFPTQKNSPIYAGWQAKYDCAHVYALRRGGAIILGKTTTTQFAIAGQPATRNPFDTARSAGGSSTGSCAAVGARMLPLASGNQGRGSIVRPAGYNACYALKPTQGAINSGGSDEMIASHTVLGFVGGSLADVWETAHFVANAIGGDRGFPGLFGEAALAPAAKPARVIKLETAGWAATDAASKAAFEGLVARLGKVVPVIGRADDQRIEALEQSLAAMPEIILPIIGYDARWPGLFYRDLGRSLLNEEIARYLEPYANASLDDYRAALRRRDALRAQFANIAEIAPLCLAPVQTGPPPPAGENGDPVYGDVTSALGTPAVVLPLLAVAGLPFGVQVMGQAHDDYRLFGWARWIADWARAEARSGRLISI
jgi:Asp-tRNA(Asn)/Glu-tRNA(Gln) amidotransferase A subunit family amidase